MGIRGATASLAQIAEAVQWPWQYMRGGHANGVKHASVASSAFRPSDFTLHPHFSWSEITEAILIEQVG
jgi:hypothetical protein